MNDDVDDQFRDIVSSQLADLDAADIDEDAFAGTEFAETEPDPVAPPPPTRTVYELTAPRSWTPPPEDDDFVPPPPLPPARSPSSVAWLGILTVVAGIVILGGVVLGRFSSWWGTPVGFLSVCAGVVVLFTRLPKSHGPDNGARV